MVKLRSLIHDSAAPTRQLDDDFDVCTIYKPGCIFALHEHENSFVSFERKPRRYLCVGFTCVLMCESCRAEPWPVCGGVAGPVLLLLLTSSIITCGKPVPPR